MPTETAPASAVAPCLSVTSVSVPYSATQTHSAVPSTVQLGGIPVPSGLSNMTCTYSSEQSSRFNNSWNMSIHVK